MLRLMILFWLHAYCFSLYNDQWHDAQVDLSYIMEVERPKVQEKPQKVSVCIANALFAGWTLENGMCLGGNKVL